ncbi:hypothetical protein EGW08_018374, partial [Elysia chlorotica]
MDKLQLNQAQQTLEALNLSGSIVVYLDDKPSVRLAFSQKIKVYFDVRDNSQSHTITSGCHLRALAAFDHDLTDTGCEQSCDCTEDSGLLDEEDLIFANAKKNSVTAGPSLDDSSQILPHSGAASYKATIKQKDNNIRIDDCDQILVQCD